MRRFDIPDTAWCEPCWEASPTSTAARSSTTGTTIANVLVINQEMATWTPYHEDVLRLCLRRHERRCAQSKMAIYNKLRAEMIEAGIENPDRFLVKPFSVFVEFSLHPTRDVMCCKVAGNYLEISRKDLEEKNYAPFFDAMYEALDGVLDMTEPGRAAKMAVLMQEPLPDPDWRPI